MLPGYIVWRKIIILWRDYKSGGQLPPLPPCSPLLAGIPNIPLTCIFGFVEARMYRVSGTFDSDFSCQFGDFFLNCQTKFTANTIFKRTLLKYLKAILANLPHSSICAFCQNAKLDVCQMYHAHK